MRSTSTSLESLERRLGDQKAFVTLNNAFNDFNVHVPTSAGVHWAAHAKPCLKKALAAFDHEDMKLLTFSDLKQSFPDVYRNAIEGLDFIIRSGGRI